MTVPEWLAQVEANKEALRQFIDRWHPAMLAYYGRRDRTALPITASGPELACQNVRQKIAREEADSVPLFDFDEALEKGDWGKINNLLNAAWFGVPESTSCWQIRGFREAVELMEDPPETEEAAG